jgi:hypothetical protein
MTAIQDLIDLPEHVHRGDFVLRLTEGVEKLADTLRDYVVTPQLVECFDEALKFIRSAVEAGSSKAAFLHGSFGSGGHGHEPVAREGSRRCGGSRMLESDMPPETDKQRAIEAIQALPEGATIEDAIERLCFILKVEDGLRQSRAGQVVSHDEVKKRFIS